MMDLQEYKEEQCKIRLKLVGEFDTQPPIVDVLVNNKSIFNGPVTLEPKIIHAHITLQSAQDHEIKIKRTGKDNNCPEQLLKVIDLEINKISIRDMIWHKSCFFPEYPEPWASQQKAQGIVLEDPVYGETILGHNGTWAFKFSVPFYEFLIDMVKQ